jgi:transcriptional regulator with XRE-family HTH domain
MADENSVGEKIRRLRVAARLSQEKVAELAGLSRPTYRRYEAGQVAKMEGLAAIAKALGVGVYELIPGRDPMEGTGRVRDGDVEDWTRELAHELLTLSEGQRRNFFAHMHGYLSALKTK